MQEIYITGEEIYFRLSVATVNYFAKLEWIGMSPESRYTPALLRIPFACFYVIAKYTPLATFC